MPPTFAEIASSALRCASWNAATIRSCSISTSSFDTASGSILIDCTCLAPLMVTVTVNGMKQVLSLTIDPEVVSKDDVAMLQDLILAAINDAQRKADETMQQQMSGMMGGMKIPGLF